MLDALLANRRAGSHPSAAPRAKDLGPSRSNEGGPEAQSGASKEGAHPPSAKGEGTRPGGGGGKGEGTRTGTGHAKGESTRPGTGHGKGEGTRPGTGHGKVEGTRPGTGHGKGEGVRPGTGHAKGEGMRSFMLAFAKHDLHHSRGPLSGRAGGGIKGTPSGGPRSPGSGGGGRRGQAGAGAGAGGGGGGVDAWADDEEESCAVQFQLGEVSCREFRLADVISATRGFSAKHILGRGNFSVVYHGTTPEGQSFAFKRLKKVAEPGSAHSEALRKEVQTLSGLSHRGIVQLHGYCFTKSEQVLVYELAEGGTLQSALKGPRGKGCQLYLRQRVRIALSIARAVGYLHQMGVIHRDIKPGNILLTRTGPGVDVSAKVADFGLLKVLDPQMEYTMTALAGTFGYMDPVCMRSGKTSFTSDLYAVGIVILSLLTGRDPAVADPQDLGVLVEREGQRRSQQAAQQQERQKRRALKMLKRLQAAEQDLLKGAGQAPEGQGQGQAAGSAVEGGGERGGEGASQVRTQSDTQDSSSSPLLPSPSPGSEPGPTGTTSYSSGLLSAYPSSGSTGSTGASSSTQGAPGAQGAPGDEGSLSPGEKPQSKWGRDIPKSHTSPASTDAAAGPGQESPAPPWLPAQSLGTQKQTQAASWEGLQGVGSEGAPGASKRGPPPLSLLEELHAVGREEAPGAPEQSTDGGAGQGRGGGAPRGGTPPAFREPKGALPAPSLMPLRKWCAQMLKFREHKHLADAFLRPLFDMEAAASPHAGEGKPPHEGDGLPLPQHTPKPPQGFAATSLASASVSVSAEAVSQTARLQGEGEGEGVGGKAFPTSASAASALHSQQQMPLQQLVQMRAPGHPASQSGPAELAGERHFRGTAMLKANSYDKESPGDPGKDRAGTGTGSAARRGNPVTGPVHAGSASGAGAGGAGGAWGSGGGDGGVLPGANVKAVEECVELAVRLTDDDAKYRPTILETTEKLRLILNSIPTLCRSQYQELTPGVMRAVVGEEAWEYLASAAAAVVAAADADAAAQVLPEASDPAGGSSLPALRPPGRGEEAAGGCTPQDKSVGGLPWENPVGGAQAEGRVLKQGLILAGRDPWGGEAVLVEWRPPEAAHHGHPSAAARAVLQLASGLSHKSLLPLAAACVTDTRGIFLVYPAPREGVVCLEDRLLGAPPGPIGAQVPEKGGTPPAGGRREAALALAASGRSKSFSSKAPRGSPETPSASPSPPPSSVSTATGKGAPGAHPPVQGRKLRAASEDFRGNHWRVPSVDLPAEFLASGGDSRSLRERVGLALGVAEAVFHLHANGLWHGALGPDRVFLRGGASSAPLLVGIGHLVPGRSRKGDENASWRRDSTPRGADSTPGAPRSTPESEFESVGARSGEGLEGEQGEEGGGGVGKKEEEGEEEEGTAGMGMPKSQSLTALQEKKKLSQQAAGCETPGDPRAHQASQDPEGFPFSPSSSPAHPLSHSHRPSSFFPRSQSASGTSDAGPAPPQLSVGGGSPASFDRIFLEPILEGSPGGSPRAHRGGSSLEPSRVFREDPAISTTATVSSSTTASSSSRSSSGSGTTPSSSSRQQEQQQEQGQEQEHSTSSRGTGVQSAAVSEAPEASVPLSSSVTQPERKGDGSGVPAVAQVPSADASAADGAGAGAGTGGGEEEGRSWIRRGSLRGASMRYTGMELHEIPLLEDVHALGLLMLSVVTGRGPIVENVLDLAFVEKHPPPQRMSLHGWVACLIDQGQTHVLLGPPVHQTAGDPSMALGTSPPFQKQRSRTGRGEDGGGGGVGGAAGGVSEREGKDRHALEAVLALSLQCLKADHSARPDSREVVSRLRAILGSLEEPSPEKEAPASRPSRLKGALIRQHGAKRGSAH